MVEHEYSVVGILDKMNVTLQVLEQYVPRFFTGSSKIFFGKGAEKNQSDIGGITFNLCFLLLFFSGYKGYARRHENRYIKSKPALSEQVLAKLRDSLSDEYELYDFCQQRLYHQYQQTISTN